MTSWRSVVGTGAVVLALGLFALMASEWWPFLVQRDFSRAGEYPFGTEQGWSYSNPVVYAWSTLAATSAVLAMTVLVRWALVRRSWAALGGVILLLVAWVATDRLCSGVEWHIFDRSAQERSVTG